TAAIPGPVTEALHADPGLPEPLDPQAAIAMLPPRAPSVPAVVPAPSLAAPVPTPPPVAPESSPVPFGGLDRDALGRAFAALGRSHGLPASVVQSVSEAYDRLAGIPLWTADGRLTPRADSMLRAIGRADQHGLSPARFARLQAALSGTADRESREAAGTLLAVAYAREARGARINPQQVSRLITVTLTLPEPEEVLARVVAAPDAGLALEAFNPTHPGYLALKRKLAELGSAPAAEAGRPKLTFGPVLTQGMSDARVPIVRDLLGLPPADTAVFDRTLADSLKAFQRERGLRASGRLDRATTAALGGVPETEAAVRNPRADIIANMERWRWLPTELGADHILVNVPDFRLMLVQNDAPVWQTRVIVGKPETQTPVFSHRMQFLVVNPSWNVPPSIALKEYLPLLQRNPQALSARGLQVVSRGRVVDPASVDWSKVGRTVAIRQPPGERNALGHIKFMFPNQHAVYLHDTPNRSLFANERRAYSHGCVRVQDPFRLAEAIMGTDWPERRLRSMVGGGERQINLPTDLPVHLAYFTTFVDDAGALQSREDLYGHNRKVKALLGF
ncbi:MAG TPA: L,D-transpeptidase family protein, partial [Beijerinckiaceae bacterium]|nr:L,D-transpeptidase family protein [Beijerinckiaceae bacterium]